MTEGEKEVTAESLTVNMKATIGLMISFMIFMVVGIFGALVTGPFDIWILASLIILVPYIILVAFCWRRKPWAYLGSMVLGIFVVVVTPPSIFSESAMSPFLMWQTVFATTLSTLIALEGFKAYLESKKP